jgi:hypothetical protein
MSKPYKVDTWIGPFEDFPEGTEIHTRELEHDLVCSDDEKRAYVKEGDEWVLFEIVEKAASNPPGDQIWTKSQVRLMPRLSSKAG